MPACEPAHDCARCPRLAAFRKEWSSREATWHNAPVPSFGTGDSRLLIVGLAPGLRGANATGRPFTGDYAGDLLYDTLRDFGLASGTYAERADDDLALHDCRITNAVRCVPPENKPTTTEINTCRDYLSATINAMPRLSHVLALGAIAHQSTVRALGGKPSHYPFRHGGVARIGTIALHSSYHCSRYNTNTGVLTVPMFRQIFADLTRAMA